MNYVPKIGDTTAPRDLQEAADYYLTPRGQHPNSTNQMLMTSISTLASFTGFEGAETFLTQPLLMVAGSEAGSLWHSQELHAKAASKAKELFIVDGATHMDLYDGDGSSIAARKLAPSSRATSSRRCSAPKPWPTSTEVRPGQSLNRFLRNAQALRLPQRLP